MSPPALISRNLSAIPWTARPLTRSGGVSATGASPLLRARASSPAFSFPEAPQTLDARAVGSECTGPPGPHCECRCAGVDLLSSPCSSYHRRTQRCSRNTASWSLLRCSLPAFPEIVAGAAVPGGVWKLALQSVYDSTPEEHLKNLLPHLRKLSGVA